MPHPNTVPPVRVVLARTPEELAAAQRLRFQVLVREQRWTYPAEQVRDGRLAGPNDASAYVFNAWLPDPRDRRRP